MWRQNGLVAANRKAQQVWTDGKKTIQTHLNADPNYCPDKKYNCTNCREMVCNKLPLMDGG